MCVLSINIRKELDSAFQKISHITCRINLSLDRKKHENLILMFMMFNKYVLET